MFIFFVFNVFLSQPAIDLFKIGKATVIISVLLVFFICVASRCLFSSGLGWWELFHDLWNCWYFVRTRFHSINFDRMIALPTLGLDKYSQLYFWYCPYWENKEIEVIKLATDIWVYFSYIFYKVSIQSFYGFIFMEVYTSILEVETVRQPSNMTIF